LSTLPPGRFLMPGDLDGSPALTFAPLARPRRADGCAPARWHALMERRYEAYKIPCGASRSSASTSRGSTARSCSIDAMQALNAGPAAMADLERALTEILACFRPGATAIS
jgi:predicted YcjX-like family ATPase